MNENKNKYREVKLAQALNGFMYNFGLEDFYSKLSIDKILQLKLILSDINNIITLRVTRLFVDFLLHEGIIDKYEHEEINNDINSTDVNTNGYDVRYDKKKIIAEVKCNIPVNDNSYGAAQEYTIIKDINGLLSREGKNKVDISECDLNLYYKFMVVLRTDKTEEAMQKIIKKINKTNNPSVIEYTKEQCFDKSKVYIVYIDYTK
ncbi:MAG: hypothetical protein IKL56_00905 [Bacteroidaceae bacterium]|nr:hypothetical protein [Bacteroidaceae bacterium]